MTDEAFMIDDDWATRVSDDSSTPITPIKAYMTTWCGIIRPETDPSIRPLTPEEVNEIIIEDYFRNHQGADVQ